MAALASGDVTYTQVDVSRINTRRKSIFDISFGDGSKTYPSNGVPLNKDKLGMKRQLDYVVATPQDSTIGWTYDATNETLRGIVGQDMPFLVVEEKVLLTSSVGTMSWKPGYILAIEGDDGTLHDVIPSTETPGANEVAVDYDTGGITVGTGPSAHVLMTYIPIQPTGLFSDNYIVSDESQTVSSGSVTLNNRAACIQYIYDTTTSTFLSPIPVGETPGPNQVAIDIQDGSNDTVLTLDSTRNANVLQITYFKHIGIGAEAGTFGFVDQADLTLTSQAFDFGDSSGQNRKGLVIPGLGTRIVGEGAGGPNKGGRITGPNDTAGESIIVWDPSKNTLTANDSIAWSTFELPLLLMDSDWRVYGNTRELHVTEEVPAVNIRLEATGW